MEYRLKGGVTLSDADFGRMADEAEREEYPGIPGEWVVRPQGRPALDGGELVSVTFKMTKAQRDALDRRAESRDETRSQLRREALSREHAFA